MSLWLTRSSTKPLSRYGGNTASTATTGIGPQQPGLWRLWDGEEFGDNKNEIKSTSMRFTQVKRQRQFLPWQSPGPPSCYDRGSEKPLKKRKEKKRGSVCVCGRNRARKEERKKGREGRTEWKKLTHPEAQEFLYTRQIQKPHPSWMEATIVTQEAGFGSLDKSLWSKLGF